MFQVYFIFIDFSVEFLDDYILFRIVFCFVKDSRSKIVYKNSDMPDIKKKNKSNQTWKMTNFCEIDILFDVTLYNYYSIELKSILSSNQKIT